MSTTLTVAPDGTVTVVIGDAPVAPAPPVELSTTVAPPATVAPPVAPAAPAKRTRRTTPAPAAPVADVVPPAAPVADAPAKRVKRTPEENKALLAYVRAECDAGAFAHAREITPVGWASTFAEIDRREAKAADTTPAAPKRKRTTRKATVDPAKPSGKANAVTRVEPAITPPPTPSEDKPKRAPVARDARGRILSKAAAAKLIAPEYLPTPEEEHETGAEVAARDAAKDARHLMLAEYRKSTGKRVRELVKAGDADDLADAYVDLCEMRDALDDAAAATTGADAAVLTQKAVIVANAADKVEKAAEKLNANA